MDARVKKLFDDRGFGVIAHLKLLDGTWPKVGDRLDKFAQFDIPVVITSKATKKDWDSQLSYVWGDRPGKPPTTQKREHRYYKVRLEGQMNPYYDTTNDQPNDVGLVQVIALDEAGLSYEFNILVVVKHIPSGRIFYAADSGCSCPIPFEREHFNSPDDTSMIEIKRGDSYDSFQRDVDNFPATREERDEVLTTVLAELRRGASK